MSETEFIKQLEEIGIILTELQQKKLNEYCTFLLEYNSHTNLTAIKDPNAVYLKHFYDSLMAAKYVDFHKISSLLDIGTGAGFPGMVLKIVFPSIRVTLLDSNHKKTDFLKELVKRLQLSDIEIINARAEEYAQSHLEEFDMVTSRAVAKLRILVELGLPMLKTGGHFIALKGNCEEELEEALDTISIMGGKVAQKVEDNLPIEESIRTFVDVEKFTSTPTGYPRKYDKIVRNPLVKKTKIM